MLLFPGLGTCRRPEGAERFRADHLWQAPIRWVLRKADERIRPVPPSFGGLPDDGSQGNPGKSHD